MKKIKNLLLILAIFLVLPVSVFASGSISPSPRSLTITKGSTATFRITASNAVGRVDISSSNSSIASINTSSQWLENNSVTVTVTGISAGTTSIVVKLSDAATFDEEELSGSYTVSVTVKEPSTNNSNTNNKPNNNANNKPNNYSTNNKLKELSIEGYELSKKDSNNYELTVNNNVTDIKINGTAEDSKAKIDGLGNKKLEVGLNTFEIVVIAESGAKNKIIVNVTRKDGYYIEDLEDLIKDDSLEIKNIIIKDNTIINNDIIKKMNKKNVTFNYTNDNISYYWTVDGSKAKKNVEFSTLIEFSEFDEKIDSTTNYSKGIYLNFTHEGELPEGTKVGVKVSDKYKDGDKLNIYYYNSKTQKIEFITSTKVKYGYAEFEIEHCSKYFLTMANINTNISTAFNIYLVISIIELFAIIAIIVCDILKLNPLLKSNNKKTKK